MTKVKVRYLVARSGADGTMRYYWQPRSEWQKLGWTARRVPDDWRSIDDPVALEAAAIAAAQALNAELDAWRLSRVAGDAAPAPRAVTAPAIAANPQPRTVAALIREYKASPKYRAKRASTRRGYDWCLSIIEEWAGEAPVRVMEPPRFLKFYEALFERTPAKANAVMRVARILFEHARRHGWRRDNPAKELGLEGTRPRGRLWPREAVERFVQAADAMGRHSVGTAVLLNEWLGQRQGDLLRLPRNILRQDGHTIWQSKGLAGVRLRIADVPHIRARVEEELRRADAAAAARAKGKGAMVQPTKLLLDETTGRPWHQDTFRHVFAEIRAAAADRMREEKGWYRRKDGSWWHDDVARELGLSGRKLAEAMAREARRAASFEVEYIVAGANPDDPDAFQVAMEDLWFLHLRHTAITRLAESGCTTAEIAAVSGHDPAHVDVIIKRYLVRTSALARQAFARRLEAEAAAREKA